MLRIDQRAFKAALQEALHAYETHGDLGRFTDAFDVAAEEHDNYLNVEAVHDELAALLRVGNVKRARKLVSHLPDATASRLVVSLQLVGIFLFVGLVLALVVGVAIFLWQHFFG